MPLRLRTRALVRLTTAAGAVLLLTELAGAQSLSFALFERYLDSLRDQARIPGLAATIVQDGRVVWEQGFGVADLETGAPVTGDTPFLVGDLTQTVSAVLIGQCIERGTLVLDAAIRNYTDDIRDLDATVKHVLAHASDGTVRGFRYDPSRYATLTAVVERCSERAFRQAVHEEVLGPLGMWSSVPGADLGAQGNGERELFDGPTLDRFGNALSRLAAPHRVDRDGRAARHSLAASGMDAATGLVSTARDFARYDAALDDGELVGRGLLAVAWRRASMTDGTELPTGLGWFVQDYERERVIWHFGSVRDGYSSLWLKVPGRNLTLILLANSEGLSAGFRLHEGDVGSSLFARLFLRMFLL